MYAIVSLNSSSVGVKTGASGGGMKRLYGSSVILAETLYEEAVDKL